MINVNIKFTHFHRRKMFVKYIFKMALNIYSSKMTKTIFCYICRILCFQVFNSNTADVKTATKVYRTQRKCLKLKKIHFYIFI